MPFTYHRFSQRWAALFDAHDSPIGTSHQRCPVISIYNNLVNTLSKGVGGIPSLRIFELGNKSANIYHSESLKLDNPVFNA
ncbi:hypothetical protein TI04_01230 [Achromatium sp. WMS2]|nr:hypothetical protein TI04_01230 [Achromatium sp. WMS2]